MVAGDDVGTDEIAFGPFRLKPTERLLLRNGDPVPVGARALDILIALATRPGQVVGKRELLERVWPDVIVEEANLRVHMTTLRKVLGDGHDGARYITSAHGRGYSFVAPLLDHETGKSSPQGTVRPVSVDLAKLPPLLARMVGRDETVRSLSIQLTAQRFVSVVGPGGIGKTTVAVAVGHRLLGEFHGQVCFVDLGALNDPLLVAAAVSSAVGSPVRAQDPLSDLVAFVSDKRMLLIVDNCEHIIDAAADLMARLFREVPTLHLLTTSREALRVQGENVHLLTPLEGPDSADDLTAENALATPAVQLFMQRAAASGHRVELTDDDAPTVARICERLDGIALAIELVASRAGAYGIRGTSDLLDSRFKLLWQGQRSAQPRHRTLQAMLDWSYFLLSSREQLVLRRLSVLVGHFMLDSAVSIADGGEVDEATVASAIDGLVDKSLVWLSRRGGATLYRLPDTTRIYAGRKLAESDEGDAILKRHAAHFRDVLRESGAGATVPGSHDLAVFEWHLGNVRAALEWCYSGAGDTVIGTELAAYAAPLFLGSSLFIECRLWCERALAVLPQAELGTRRELMLQQALANASLFIGSPEARTALERALGLAEKLGDSERQMHLHAGLSIILTGAGEIANGGLKLAERSLTIAEEMGDTAAIVLANWLLASAHLVAGNQAVAEHCGERALALSIASGRADFSFFGYDQYIRGLVSLSQNLWLRGLPVRAVKIAQQAVDAATRRSGILDLAIALTHSTRALLWSGDLDQAADRIQRSIAHTRRYSLGRQHAVALGFQGELMVARGEANRGVEMLRSALPTVKTTQPVVAVFLLTALAKGLHGCQKPDEADSAITAALRIEKNTETYIVSETLRTKAEVLLAMPQPDHTAAEDYLRRSIDRARTQSALGWELRSATTLARLWQQQGRSVEARELLAGVYAQFTEGFETPDLRAAAQVLGELATS